MQTEWFPTRGGPEIQGISDPGMILHPLHATLLANGKMKLSGSFGVFFPGTLWAHLYDAHGASVGKVSMGRVNPTEPVSLDSETASPAKAARISLHLQDDAGVDRGSLQEVRVSGSETGGESGP